MKVLQNIKSETIVGIDIESVRICENFEDLDEGTQSAWEYKNKQEGEIPEWEKLKELWQKNASLYAEFSKVCAVSLSFLHDGSLYCKEFYGDNEKALLESLSITLNNILVKDSSYRLCGHSAKFFDYPFLGKRYLINGLELPKIIDSTASKPWEQTNLCTNELWKLGGTGAGSSLQALCNALKIPVSKVDLVGDEVGKSFYNKEYARIGRYCSYDTVATFNVVRRLKGESIFEFNNVNYILSYSDEIQNKEEEEQVPLLQKIYQSGTITEEVKKELKELLSKKKATKKEKEILKNIILSVYYNKKDKVAEKKKKELEVQQFIDSL